MIKREISFQQDTTQRETMVNQHQSQGQITNDADPVANAMFNGKVAIYGERFVQNLNVVAEADKSTWAFAKSDWSVFMSINTQL
jgi:hypothetical protein